ncbi:MAG: arylsulfatase [Verrucomicrobiota bacterium]
MRYLNSRTFTLIFAVVVGTAWGTSATKPNIVYILADDLGYGDVSSYGQSRFETPHIDRLAREGMRFTQHYSGSTVCAPARCTLMTGLHTGNAPIRGNGEVQPEGQQPMPADTFTIAKYLKKAGYATGVFGKWGLGYPGSSSEPLKMGFDRFYGYNCQRIAHSYYPAFLWNDDKREFLWGNVASHTRDYAPYFIHEQAIEFIRENKDQPFFLYYAAIQPHADMIAPEDYMDKFRGKYLPESENKGGSYIPQPEGHAAFAAMVNVLDDHVGGVLEELDRLGLRENTLVIFASDNGPHTVGGHNPDYFDSNGIYRGYKRDLYEGGIRVPMIASWPGTVESGAVTDHVSAFWDILPTAAELVGEPLEAEVDGVSMAPTLTGKGTQKGRDYLYWEFPSRGGRIALRQGNWKAVRYNVSKNPDAPVQLFDLSKDPSEENNVAGKHPEVVERLAKLMAEARQTPEIDRYRLWKN